MKVKAIDIAQRLGISKATVSLALNNKPGVSEEKKALIFKCKEEMEEQIENAMARLDEKENKENERSESQEIRKVEYKGLTIKVIMYDCKLGILCDSALNVWTEILRIFDSEAKKAGYNIGITYVGNSEKEIAQLVEECNSPSVAGVILYGTEMKKDDFNLGLRAIRKPMVIFDYDAGERYNSVVIDNAEGVQKAVEYLSSRGCKKIEYLSQKIDIYNFECRRAGFVSGVYRSGLSFEECQIIPVGTTIDSVDLFMQNWFQFHELPDAFLMENYQVSIGVTKALRTMNIKVPEQISLLGIDELPSFMTGNMQLDCVKVEHRERGYMTIELLLQEIEQEKEIQEQENGERKKEKVKVASRCKLVLGDTVC